ncbi:DUF2252 domain-containing protein [Iamia majanohamensis]|uniref:DUF2252 domain-containing protein n=1 Tax=Iamia majanohamensis TaxID=467976 RepID=A0AAE9YDH7_9ACTN|nr:DUF2252 domain-containing protein [Iamia majanohamensis]WCO66797.1 DUF2252 domain-containing protein [Iamia majanohamensis]
MSAVAAPPPPPAPDDLAARAQAGRDVRARLPRSSLGRWEASPSRRDPVAILADQEASRVPELVPVRHERMAASPFAFFRGAAAVFAADLASRDHTGLTVQLCGDAHLANFGAFASPERTLVFDLNDFDETLPGPFEWDLARLAASVEVAARANGHDPEEREATQQVLTRSYATAMAELAGTGHLDVWYSRLSLDEAVSSLDAVASPAVRARVQRALRKARGKDNLRAFDKLITTVDGEPRFVSDPPLLVRAEELLPGMEHVDQKAFVAHALEAYGRTLSPERRILLHRYRFVDLARKVVGVGSVGTRCWVALLMGRDETDPLLLQVKEAEASVLEAHLGPSACAQHGQRVVEGQKLVQSASDVLLGWERLETPDGATHDFYFRQLWDWKGSAAVDDMDPTLLGGYAHMCGRTLARAHARTGDPVAISAYVGRGGSMARAMARFASDYADQNARDHADFVARVTGAPPAA